VEECAEGGSRGFEGDDSNGSEATFVVVIVGTGDEAGALPFEFVSVDITPSRSDPQSSKPKSKMELPKTEARCFASLEPDGEGASRSNVRDIRGGKSAVRGVRRGMSWSSSSSSSSSCSCRETLLRLRSTADFACLTILESPFRP